MRARWRTVSSQGRRTLRFGVPEPAFGRPVFIVGCGHSGTTLLLSILSAHPAIFGVPYESSLADRSPAEVDWFVREFNRRTKRAGKERWVEKTPSHIHEIGWLLRRFPTCNVLVMVRDGRDVACSLRDRTGDFTSGVMRWLDDNMAAEPFLAEERVHRLPYERLVADRRAFLEETTEFLGERFEPPMLEHEKSSFRFYGRYQGAQTMAAEIDAMESPPHSVSGRDHRLYRSWQARQPVFDGRGRWSTDLTDAERKSFKRLAGAKLVEYGYADSLDW